MDIADVIATIGGMPTEFRRRGNVSMIQLLKDSGYLNNSTEVTVQRLRDHFRDHAEDLAAWVRNSEDNRGSPAWFIVEPDIGEVGSKWLVGHNPGDQCRAFKHDYEACAIYVKRWLEQTGGFIAHAS